MADPRENDLPNPQTEGVNISAGNDMGIGSDLVGRDKKIVEATTYIENATFTSVPAPTNSSSTDRQIYGHSPYKGLQYFDEGDADLFFGRELLTAHLVKRLRDVRFLAVVGASGSGKSSLIRAGLVPAFRRGEPLVDHTKLPDGSSRWPVHIITPTAHPLKALAVSLTRDSESVTATTRLIDDLAQDKRSLDIAASRNVNRASTNRLLLIVDQFEELFTACRDETERQAFIDNLLHASISEADGSTIVVLTLRADFYAHCGQFDSLREALSRWQEYIGHMNTEELRRAIEEPAKRGGWKIETGLVELLLRDIGNEPGALPLLSHALFETWERRQGYELTLEGYQRSGGVHGAIAKTAEIVFSQRLAAEQQIIARNIFLRLTELGEGTQDTRRRASFTELIPKPEDRTAVETVLKILADARLITTADGMAEVAHEALIREWPTLRKWLDEGREGLKIHRRLTEAVQEWNWSERDSSELYRGARLIQAVSWMHEHQDQLSALEHEFLDQSKALAEHEKTERETQLQSLLEATKVQEELAEESNRIKNRFLSLTSHELRTPLNLIVGLCEVLLREQVGAGATLSVQSREDLEHIHASAQHLSGLIRDVLDLASSETGQLKLVREPLDLRQVLEVVAGTGQSLAQDKGLNWRAEIPESLPLVWGDRTRLRQVALNLVSNAIKFTTQGEVTLKVEAREKHLAVLVSDTGLGIPPVEQSVIFNEFWQSERTTARGYGGLGLGLAICKRLIELHGGEIGVWSSGEEGSGSTFYFTLPILEKQEMPPKG